MALKVPGRLRRIDTNEESAESQLSARGHKVQQSKAIYRRRTTLQTDAPLAQAGNLFPQLLRTNGYGEERSGVSHFRATLQASGETVGPRREVIWGGCPTAGFEKARSNAVCFITRCRISLICVAG